MSKSEPNPLRLDVATCATQAQVLAGQWPLASLARLAASLHAERPAGAGDQVVWSARGELLRRTGERPQTWLHLQARVEVALQCQRCLEPVIVPLQIDRALRFVEGEAEAATLDADSEDDVLALPRWLDLRELIEDELLLALPLVPRHDVCPRPLRRSGSAADEAEGADGARPNPFAVLERLKTPGAGH